MMKILTALGPVDVRRSDAAGVWEFSGPPNVMAEICSLWDVPSSFFEGENFSILADAQDAERYMCGLLLLCGDDAVPHDDEHKHESVILAPMAAPEPASVAPEEPPATLTLEEPEAPQSEPPDPPPPPTPAPKRKAKLPDNIETIASPREEEEFRRWCRAHGVKFSETIFRLWRTERGA